MEQQLRGLSTRPQDGLARRSLTSRLAAIVRTCAHLGLGGTMRLVQATALAPAATQMARALVGLLAPSQQWPEPLVEEAAGLPVLAPVGGSFSPVGSNPELVSAGGGETSDPPATDLSATRSSAEVRVRRSYRDRRREFRKELRAFRRLRRSGVPLPELVDVDGSEPALVVAYQSGNQVMPGASPELVAALVEHLGLIHRAGFILGTFAPDMVVVDTTGRPTWISFPTARDLSWLPWWLRRFLADVDVEAFNEFFGTAYPTYGRLRVMAQSGSLSRQFGAYSPAYLGAGMRTGPIWSLGTGWGRWESILRRRLPDPDGKRILDLGSNNGHMGLEMLRAGASEVVGIEMNPERVGQAERLKQAYQWSDGRHLRYRTLLADMREATHLGLGSFDMVTALCSLYYLAEDEMLRLLTELAEITPLVVLECNLRQDIGRTDPDTYRKASVDFNRALLHAAGFRHVEAIAPSWSMRPLLVARR